MALVIEDILNANDHASKLSSYSQSNFLVNLGCLLKSGLGINFDEGVEVRLRLNIL
jgi:hypothetical protein